MSLFSAGYSDRFMWLDSFLKTKVEIIEEDNNKIEKLGNDFMIELHQQATSIEPFVYKMAKKLDEIIDKLNNME